MINHVLKRPEEFSTPPTIALYMVVKNAESVIERTLKHVAPYVKELVFVLNDCTDGTEDKIHECHRKYFPKKENYLTISYVEYGKIPFDYPDYYFLDTKESYSYGVPFRGEEYEGPFTEKPLLCDWAKLRNWGWRHETDCQWKLFLDADDTMEDPESLWGVCDLLTQHGADLGLSLYKYNVWAGQVFGQTYRERLVRNKPEIKWTGEVHEIITGHQKAVAISGNLIVTDNKDNRGEGTRVPDRDFKVLYRKGRMTGWNLTSREFSLLGKEIAFKMPTLALCFLSESIRPLIPGPAKAYGLRMMGVIYLERLNDPTKANLCLIESLELDPSPKTAFIACSSMYRSGMHADTMKMYEVGCLLENRLESMDEGPGHKMIARMAVCAAIQELRPDMDKEKILEVVKTFPSDPSIKTLHEEIKKCLLKK